MFSQERGVIFQTCAIDLGKNRAETVKLHLNERSEKGHIRNYNA
jgi:hypothetical protein